MRFALVHLAIAAPALFAALPAQAQTLPEPQPFETVAAATIQSGDYAKAERILDRQMQLRADAPEVLLNLAAVYLHAGRTAEARALYDRVLAQQPVAMDMVNDSAASSHAVARTGLRRIDAASVTLTATR